MKQNILLRHSPVRPGIEPVLPLINVVFLLLIFFLMTGKMQKPAISTIKPPEQFVIKGSIDSDAGDWLYIGASGALTWRGNEVSDLTVLKALPSPLIVFADGVVTGKVLNRALGQLSAADINEVAIVTEKVQP